MVIGVLIIKTAIEIGKENIDNIMGKVPSDDLINQIKKIANETTKNESAHNIKIDYFGSYATVSLHIELDGDMSLNESHRIVHLVQENITNEIPMIKSAVVHACPIGLEYEHDQEIDK